MTMETVTIRVANKTIWFIYVSRRSDGLRCRLGERQFGKGRVGRV